MKHYTEKSLERFFELDALQTDLENLHQKINEKINDLTEDEIEIFETTYNLQKLCKQYHLLEKEKKALIDSKRSNQH